MDKLLWFSGTTIEGEVSGIRCNPFGFHIIRRNVNLDNQSRKYPALLDCFVS